MARKVSKPKAIVRQILLWTRDMTVGSHLLSLESVSRNIASCS